MKFFGYGTMPNGTSRRAFLTDGDEVYIVGEGDTLLGKFRVMKIGNANLDFEEIASGRRGSTHFPTSRQRALRHEKEPPSRATLAPAAQRVTPCCWSCFW